MRILLLFALLSLSAFVFGQDTVYYNREGNFVSSIKEAEIYIVKTEIPSKDHFRNEKEYTKEGKLFEESSYSYSIKYHTLYRQGIRKRWYPNGQLKWEAFYINSKLQGKVKSFWPDGRLKRDDNYSNGVLLEGKCFSSVGKDTVYFPFEVMPHFKSDSVEQAKLYNYAYENWAFPKYFKSDSFSKNIHYHIFIDCNGKIKVRRNEEQNGNKFFEYVVRYYDGLPILIPYFIDGDAERYDWEDTRHFVRRRHW